MNILNLLSIGFGAFLGGILRYLISYILKSSPDKFPFSTFIINLLGSFVLGMIIAYTIRHELSTNLKLFLTVGLCGGFTTFSTFSIEALRLYQNGNGIIAAIYIFLSVLGGLVLAGLGMKIG